MTTRLDIRIDEELKTKAEKASALLGLKSLTEYITRIMDERSSEILSEYEQIPVSPDLFDQFARACDQAEEPNEALRSAAAYAKKRGF
jgi:uncharacterized protein (DUF1778 family)